MLLTPMPSDPSIREEKKISMNHNAVPCIDDFRWDILDDALLDTTSPMWIFAGYEANHLGSATRTTVSTLNDAADISPASAPNMAAYRTDQPYYCTCPYAHGPPTTHSTFMNTEDVSFIPTRDSDHSSFDDDHVFFPTSSYYDFQHPTQESYFDDFSATSTLVTESIASPSQAVLPPTQDTSNAGSVWIKRPIPANYLTSYGAATHAYHSQRHQQQHQPHFNHHPYHTRKRKLHFVESSEEQKNKHLMDSDIDMQDCWKKGEDDDDDGDESYINDDEDTSSDIDEGTANLQHIKYSHQSSKLKKTTCSSSKKEVDLSNEKSVAQALQSMWDSMTDPVGKYMHKRNLTPSLAMQLQLHHLLLHAPKKPRERYGPRAKKPKSSSLQLERITSSTVIAGVEAKDMHQPQDHPNQQSKHGKYEIRDSNTRARNREHARATRRRRRIFKDIDAILKGYHSGEPNQLSSSLNLPPSSKKSAKKRGPRISGVSSPSSSSSVVHDTASFAAAAADTAPALT